MEPVDAPDWLLELVDREGDGGVRGEEDDPLDYHGGLWRDPDRALDAAAEAVETAGEGTRNTTLNDRSFRMGWLVGTGHLEEGAVRQRLLDSARRSGLERSEALSTINSGLTEDGRNIREVGELNRTHAVVIVQGRTLVMNEELNPCSGWPEISLSTEADFRARYRNRHVRVQVDGRTKMVPLADHWLRHRRRLSIPSPRRSSTISRGGVAGRRSPRS